jgi:hypothetical protein
MQGRTSWVGWIAAPALAAASARSVAAPAAWNSRSSNATARAVAEKATTIPVMTSACGTGSPPNPAAAPRRATMPKNKNAPAPRRLKARIFLRGCGWVIRPYRPAPTATAPHSPNTIAALMGRAPAPADRPAAVRASRRSSASSRTRWPGSTAWHTPRDRRGTHRPETVRRGRR